MCLGNDYEWGYLMSWLYEETKLVLSSEVEPVYGLGVKK